MAEGKGIADEAKSFSQELVATLGLVELILGSVGLYGLWLTLGDSSARVLFPSTGNTVVDVGLQLFAAALLGKVIYLIVAVVAGIVRGQIKRDDRYYAPLKNALLLQSYDDEQLRRVEVSDSNLLDTAIEHLSLSDSTLRVRFERDRIRIIIAYGTSFLTLIFLVNFLSNRYEETPTWLFVLFVITFVAFIFIGYLKQRSLFSEVTNALVSLHQVEERKKELTQKTQP